MNDNEAIELLRQMVAVPSESYHEEAVVVWLARTLNDRGFDARVDEVGNLIASRGEGREIGVLLGHIDTVPGDIPVCIKDGILHGRGSVDAKGSMATFITALARIDAERLSGKVTIIGCVEEEVASSKGAWHVVKQHTPDWAVIGEPSGWDAITLGYKGHISMRVTVSQGRAHGAHEESSASEKITGLWDEIRQYAEATNVGQKRLFDLLMPRLTAIHGGTTPQGMDEASMEVQFRLAPRTAPEDLRQAMHDLLIRDGVTITFTGGIPAWSGPRTTPLHRCFLNAIRRADGRGRSLLKTGTADLNIVAPAWGCPALAYGPGDASLDHAPNEHIHLDEYLKAIGVLGTVLEQLAVKDAVAG